MILFENSILKLDYNPSTDILEIKYPDLKDYLLPEIKHSIDTMVEIIKNYDIKKLLLDSRNSTNAVSDEQTLDVATYLAKGIISTRVEKVARLQALLKDAEERSQQNIRQIKEAMALPFQLQHFTEKEVALTWLKS